jgi:hypothetical protein
MKLMKLLFSFCVLTASVFMGTPLFGDEVDLNGNLPTDNR